MIDYLESVREFHTKYRHKITDYPKIPDITTVILRRKLIEEEAREFDYAASLGNLVEIADALADLLYVIFGTALAYGIPIEEVFEEVHRSNMTKDGPNTDYGKTQKGPNWEPPNISEILRRIK